MNDRQTAQLLLDLYRGGAPMVWGPIPASKPKEGEAALVAGSDAGDILAPVFWRRGRWETALKEPFSLFEPTHWGRFDVRLMGDLAARTNYLGAKQC